MQIFKSFTPEVAVLLKNGAVGVIPTDTVYGLAASLFNQTAVERIYSLKKRPPTKRVGTILFGHLDQISDFVLQKDFSVGADYWPGPVSVELPITHGLEYAHQSHQTLAFRIPKETKLQDLLRAVGPLATSSVNIAGQPPAVMLREATALFKESVDFYVEGGDLSHQQPSKIIRLNDGKVEVLRGGAK